MASKLCTKLFWSTIGLLQLLAIGIRGVSELELGLVWIEQPHGEVVVPKKTPLTLNCSAHITDLPSNSSSGSSSSAPVSWLKDGEPLGRKGEELQLRRVTRKTEGEYQCIVTHPTAGNMLSDVIHVRTAVLERFSEEPEDLDVEEGDLGRLHCYITGIPQPQLTWERDKLPLPQNQRYSVVSGGQVLEIRSADPAEDSGQYRCHAHNMDKERYSQEATLTVTAASRQDDSAPWIIQGVGRQSARLGDTVVLECAATGFPEPTISWTGPGGLSVSRSSITDSRLSFIGQGNLQISEVRSEDEGAYACTAANSLDANTAQGTLSIHAAPVIVNKLGSQELSPGSSSTLTCSVSGRPLPTVWWTKAGSRVQPSDRIQLQEQEDGSTLSIRQVTAEDSGYYQCWAQNSQGLAHATARLHVASSRSSSSSTSKTADSTDYPYDLRAVQKSSTSVELSWRGDVTEQEPMAYSVHYLPSEEGTELQAVTGFTNHILTHLKPNTNYTFYVMGYYKGGRIQSTKKITLKTAEDYPTAAPEVQVFPLAMTSLRVTWDELTPEEARGTIKEYRVFYREHSRATESELYITVPGDVREYLLTGLEANVKYDVRVLAVTSVGVPSLPDEYWPWVSQVTDGNMSDGLPAAPTMTVKVINSTTIKVNWEPVPPTQAKMVGFRLLVTKPDSSTPLRHFIKVNYDMEQIITKLEPGTWYELKLTALNDLGDGQASVRTVRTRNADGTDGGDTNALPRLPLPPAVIQAEPLEGGGSMKVTWLKPDERDTGVTYYTVQYQEAEVQREADEADTSTARLAHSEELAVVIDGLEPYTMYKLKIRSHRTDNAGLDIPGEFSHEVQCRTQQGVPSPPQSATWQATKDTSVVVSWEPPKQPNGIILNYIIAYTKDPQEHLQHWSMKVFNGSTFSTKLEELSADTTYYLLLQASTAVGVSTPTATLKIHTGSTQPAGSTGYLWGLLDNQRDLGILIGSLIGGTCLIACAILILLRNRCFPRPMSHPDHSRAPPYNGNGYLPNHSNGNGSVLHYSLNQSNASGGRDSGDYHEMDSFTPLTQARENDECDTKGGYSYVPSKGKNGKVNGLNGIHGGSNGISRPPPNGKLPHCQLITDAVAVQVVPSLPQQPAQHVTAERELLLPPPSPIHQQSSSSLEELDTSGSSVPTSSTHSATTTTTSPPSSSSSVSAAPPHVMYSNSSGGGPAPSAPQHTVQHTVLDTDPVVSSTSVQQL